MGEVGPLKRKALLARAVQVGAGDDQRRPERLLELVGHAQVGIEVSGVEQGQALSLAPGLVAEHGGVDEVLAHAALVDGQVRPQATSVAEMGRLSLVIHGQAQVVLGHAEIAGHRPRRSAPSQFGEKPGARWVAPPRSMPSNRSSKESRSQSSHSQMKRRTHTASVMTTVRTTSMTSRQPVPLVVPEGLEPGRPDQVQQPFQTLRLRPL
ncbi:MAG: hypothetical protein ACR2GF_01595 [Acidimicrobiales bacterium]